MNKPHIAPWYRRIGPALITACVVIGPGSVLTSSQVGAVEGYSRNWLVLLAVLLMMVYVSLGAKLGVVAHQSPGTLIATRAGRPLAVLIGVCVFLIAALFQFGNNLGAYAAVEAIAPKRDGYVLLGALLLLVLNGLSLAFLFAFRDFYKALERLMMALVAIMLISFALNLAMAKPDLLALLRGFVPSWSSDMDISVLGLIGTSFVIAAAFFQIYLVQQKGWGKDDVRRGLVDARVGATIMLLITLMIMSTSAAVFHAPPDAAAEAEPVKFTGLGQVAEQLQPLLGDWGQIVFCIGVFSAAYSSFLVNSMVGGFVLSDGLGLGSKPGQFWPRVFTAVVLVVGMVMALAVILMEFNAVPAIITAQALTVVAGPLLAGVMLWLTNLPDVMGKDRNRWPTNLAAAVGFLLLLSMAYYTAAYVIPAKWANW